MPKERRWGAVVAISRPSKTIRPLSGRLQAGDQPQQGGLAGARGSEQGQYFSSGKGEADICQQDLPAGRRD